MSQTSTTAGRMLGVAFPPPAEPFKLWPHQQVAIDAALAAVKSGRPSGLWAMPCGCGKTIGFVELARRLGEPTLILVHGDELIRQSVEACAQVWPEAVVGVIQGRLDQWNATEDGRRPDVVVASVASLHERRLTAIPPDRFDFVVADECHHSPAKTWTAALEHFAPARFRLGCTATPFRLDGQGLSELFGREPLYTYALREAIEDQYLVRLSQWAISTTTDLDDVTYRVGDLAVGELSRSVNTPSRNRVVTEAYERYCEGRRALAFCVDVQHVQDLYQTFKDAGIAADYVTGETDLDTRRQSLERFAQGETQVMCNCMVLGEGFDDPGIQAVLMARPTCSRTLYTQAIGRGLRLAEGKSNCRILDFVDNSRRHKLITVLDLMGAPTTKDCKGRDVIEVADADRQQAEKQHLLESVAPLEWTARRVSPWPSLPTLAGYVVVAEWQGQEATAKQLRFLGRLGVESDRALTKGEASHLIDRSLELEAQFPSPPTSAQTWYLRQQGAWENGMTYREASARIGELKAAERRGTREPVAV